MYLEDLENGGEGDRSAINDWHCNWLRSSLVKLLGVLEP